MTREHVWPRWLIEHAKVYSEGIRWMGEGRVPPHSATLPLCKNCNHQLGSKLEGPVSRILPQLERGDGISDAEAEQLVRWLWKFEGLFAAYTWAGDAHWHYSERWTLIKRVLGDSLQEIRSHLTLAVGLINRNDPQFHDWPMGIDSGISRNNAIFVSGVFGKTALILSLDLFENLIPGCFGKYRLQPESTADHRRCFFPPVCFPFSSDAINLTRDASDNLQAAHEEFARERQHRPRFEIARSRVHIPER